MNYQTLAPLTETYVCIPCKKQYELEIDLFRHQEILRPKDMRCDCDKPRLLIRINYRAYCWNCSHLITEKDELDCRKKQGRSYGYRCPNCGKSRFERGDSGYPCKG